MINGAAPERAGTSREAEPPAREAKMVADLEGQISMRAPGVEEEGLLIKSAWIEPGVSAED